MNNYILNSLANIQWLAKVLPFLAPARSKPKMRLNLFRPVSHATIFLAVVFSANPLPADNVFPDRFGDHDGAFGVAREFDRLVALLGDDVLRELVCRIAFERYTPQSLGRAFSMPREQIIPRIDVLRGWGMVRLVPGAGGAMVVEPNPGYGEDSLRRWGLKYCPTGDSCGRPVAPPGKDDKRRLVNAYGREGGVFHSTATGEEGDSLRFGAAIDRIDAINSTDLTKIVESGRDWPREYLLSLRRSTWLDFLAPVGDDLVRIASRALHIARWKIPRKDYPEGADGYHRWRFALASYHAEKTAKILADVGYSDDEITRVAELIENYQMVANEDSQMLQDVASIVFFQYEFEAFASTLPNEKLLEIVRSTLRKMSDKGRETVRGLHLSSDAKLMIDDALYSENGVGY